MDHLRLYTFKLCPFAHRVRLALAEKGLMAEQIEIDLKNKPADFKAVSPNGRVPLLVHGSAKLWESAVILEYLEEVFPQHSLMPSQTGRQGEGAPMDRICQYLALCPDTSPDFREGRCAAARTCRGMVETVRVLEAGLTEQPGGGSYLLGDQFTLADIALYPWFEQAATLARFSAFRMPADCRGVAKWCESVAKRPAVQSCARTDDWYTESYQRYFAA